MLTTLQLFPSAFRVLLAGVGVMTVCLLKSLVRTVSPHYSLRSDEAASAALLRVSPEIQDPLLPLVCWGM